MPKIHTPPTLRDYLRELARELDQKGQYFDAKLIRQANRRLKDPEAKIERLEATIGRLRRELATARERLGE
jgi:hypothetical protein